jgi:general secretion pathway protein K
MRARPLNGEGSREGMALILAITVVALLTITVLDFFHHAWIQSALAAGYRDETRAFYAARAGQAAGRLILAEDARNNISREAFAQEWAQGLITVPMDGELVSVTIQDESGKVDMNRLVTDRGYPDERWIGVFVRLLARLDLDEALADALVDWMDSNIEPRMRGAENGYYLSLKKPYKAKNMRMDSVREIAMVKGFTPEVMARLEPHVTVWSSGKINVNTATDMTLMALDDGVTQEIAAAIIRERAQRPFVVREDIKKVTGMNDIYPKIALIIDVKGDVFSVESQATFGETTKMIRAVHRRSPVGVETLYHRLF